MPHTQNSIQAHVVGRSDRRGQCSRGRLIAERYERASTIVTSNLDLTEWDQAFPANRLLASATLDRLRHNAYCLVLDGKSNRAPRQMPAAIRPRLTSDTKAAQT